MAVPTFSKASISIDLSLLPTGRTVLNNCRLCVGGRLTPKGSGLIINDATGTIDDVLFADDGVSFGGDTATNGAKIIDMSGAIVAPGLLELQTNGMRGFHFTHFEDEQSYASKLDDIARYLPSQGVTGFYATIPTVRSDEFQKVVPVSLLKSINSLSC
jgi:N-acetylglucosamine-6-phosphate deacetylase